jgi:hypothetical protein
MLSNNAERLKIVNTLVNPWDYEEFVEACKKKGIIPLTIGAYAQKLGMLTLARVSFSNLDDKEAYTALTEEMNKSVKHSIPGEERQGCGGCGANKVVESKGLGDTVAKITHATGLNKLAELYTQITGKDCGCKSRQEALNKLFPYGIKEE